MYSGDERSSLDPADTCAAYVTASQTLTKLNSSLFIFYESDVRTINRIPFDSNERKTKNDNSIVKDYPIQVGLSFIGLDRFLVCLV